VRSQLHRDPGRAHVRDDRRDRERADAVDAAIEQRQRAFLEGEETADAGCDRRADPLGLLGDVETGVGLGLPRCRQSHLREAIHSPRLLALDPQGGVEILQLATEIDRVSRGVEKRDRPGAGLAGEQVAPGGLHVVAQRVDQAQPGDDDSFTFVFHRHIAIPPSTTSTSPVMKAASSEQRKCTARAISSGLPKRPSEVASSIFFLTSSGRTSVRRVSM